MINRPDITETDINAVFLDLQRKTAFRLNEKGTGIIISRHEMLGLIEEEMHELREAVRSGSLEIFSHERLLSVEDELIDIAVAAIVSLASIKTGKVEP